MNKYALLGGVAVVLSFGGFVTGCQYQQAKAEKTIRSLEHEYQATADKIRIEKDEKIKAINRDLNVALDGVRSRASYATKTVDGKDCNGQALSAPDAGFLIREAARADGIRVALDACYQQYEGLR
jgi:hypothetical protein